jgi:WhiB family redox-sensing transcriptional regulator
MTPTGWQDRAECVTFPADLFFGPDHESDAAREMRERSARAICATCPVTGPCLNWAVATGDRWSVSGGMTPEQRTSHVKRENRGNWGAANRARAADLGEKHCTKCDQVKLLDQFAREGNGWRSNCKDCRNAQVRQDRAKGATA